MSTEPEVVDLPLLDDDDEPRLISTHLCAPEEAIEMVRAAQTLGLGVRLQNRLRIDTDEDGEEIAVEEWILELLDSPPEVDED